MSIEIFGASRVTIENGIVTGQLAEVRNTTTNVTSGSLRYEVWALSSAYSGSGGVTGYKLLDVREDDNGGQLGPGQGFLNVRFWGPLEVTPPTGSYRLVIFVTEFTGGSQNDGFAIEDYVNFDVTYTVGGGGGGTSPPPPPPPDTKINIFGDADDDLLTGNAQDNFVYGYGGNDNIGGGAAGNDRLFGGSGDDFLFGGTGGNDRYYGGTGDDAMDGDHGRDIYYGGQGIDRVFFSFASKGVTVSLETGRGTAGPATGDRYYSIEDVSGSRRTDTLIGNHVSNSLSGNGGNDKLFGQGHRDVLFGDNGRDMLYGGNAKDNLYGGLSRDYLFGGRGQDLMFGGGSGDRFVFRSAAEAGRGGSADRIGDFNRGSGDLISLARIDANPFARGDQDFRFIGGSSFTGRPGELNYKKGMVSGDINGDGRPDFQISVTLEDIAFMKAVDFIL